MNESSPSLLTRRDAVKVIGLGTAVASLGLSHLMAAAEEAAPIDSWALPKLPYGYTALEPHIDAHTMEIHHSKHHQAYLNAAKKALEGHPEILKLTPEQVLTGLATLQVPDALRTTLRNQVGGHVNHTFFWQSIAPGGGEPGGELLAAINKTFGSLDELKKQFGDAAMKRFGSGWAWLSVKQGALTVHSTANQDSPLLEGATPILGLDVWEHAYYLNYQNRRADYVKAYWNIVNWTEAGKRYVG